MDTSAVSSDFQECPVLRPHQQAPKTSVGERDEDVLIRGSKISHAYISCRLLTVVGKITPDRNLQCAGALYRETEFTSSYGSFDAVLHIIYWNKSIDAENFKIMTHCLAFWPRSSVCKCFIFLWRAVFCAGRGGLPDLTGFLPSPAAVIKSVGFDSSGQTSTVFRKSFPREANEIFRLLPSRAREEVFIVRD